MGWVYLKGDGGPLEAFLGELLACRAEAEVVSTKARRFNMEDNMEDQPAHNQKKEKSPIPCFAAHVRRVSSKAADNQE